MESTSFAASSTISRGKVAIVLFTAAVAIYGIYTAIEIISEEDSTSPPASQPTLHRSNAVHRRHRRPTAYRPRPGEAAGDGTGDSAADTSFFVEDAEDTDEEEAAANVEANTEANQSILSQGQQIGTTVELTLGGDSDDSSDSVPWAPPRTGQNMVQLLFSISEDSTRRSAYVHRGTLCNGCGVVPIRGIRYRCANCADYDLCETCEAAGSHYRTHVFYKIKIPITNYAPRHLQTPFYPGNPEHLLRPLPREAAARLTTETSIDRSEIEAYWEQWTCIANTEIRDDPKGLHLMMDRKTFDRFLIPSNANRYSAPNLIHDRMFAFYDQDGDGMISFSEYLQGLAYRKSKNKLKRIFQGYDINGDGYVDRKDFLRIFRSYYVLYKSMRKDMLESMDESAVNGVDAHAVINGRQPLSSAFGRDGQFGSAHPNRNYTRGKRMNQFGDMEIVDDQGVILEDSEDYTDRDVVFRNSLGSFHRMPLGFYMSLMDRPPTSLRELTDRARDATTQPEALADDEENYGVSEETANEQRTQAHLNEAMHDRWRRRQFYTDEEEGAEPPADWSDHEDIPNGQANIEDEDDEDYENISSRPALPPRSRSSSKVRFAEDMDDYDTRSNPSTSSRSIPERWGGIGIAEAERDVGKDVLYQVTQQAFNELLDNLFKNIEDEAISSLASASTREKNRALFTNKYFVNWAEQVDKTGKKAVELNPFDSKYRKEKGAFDEEAFNADFCRHMAAQAVEMATQPVDLEDVRRLDTEDLLAMSGYSIDEGDAAPAGATAMSAETEALARSLPIEVDTADSSDATLPQAMAALQPGSAIPAPQRGSIPRTPRRGSETPSENLRRDMVAAFQAYEPLLTAQVQEDIEIAEDMPLPGTISHRPITSFGALNTDPNDATEGLRAYRDPALNSETYRDPTLPQFRPNSVLPAAPTPPSAVTGEYDNEDSLFVSQDESIPSGRRRTKTSSRKSRKTDMHEQRKAHDQTLFPELRRKLVKEMEGDESVELETRIQLSHWNWSQLYELRGLEQVEIQARKRGGWARINYEEFEEVLRMKDKYWQVEKKKLESEESEGGVVNRMRPGRLTGRMAEREREMERMQEYLGSWIELCIQ